MAVNKYLGPIGLTELINLIQADFQKKQDWMQFPEMPPASQYVGKVVQYTGITDTNYTKGFFYYSTGLEWTMISVASAVEVVGQLPDWDTAKDGVIYYVTSESACYIRNSTVPGEWLNIAGGDNAAFEIVSALPAWADANPKMIYIVVDGDEATAYVRSATVGKWYQLGGGSINAFEIVASVPAWSDANANVMYMVPNGMLLKAYIKNVNSVGSFYELGSDSKAFEIVANLPAWSQANENIIYFTVDNNKLKGYIKNPNQTGSWWNISGTSSVAIGTALPDWASADSDTFYLVNTDGVLTGYTKGETVGQWNELSGNEAISMEDIEDILDEVFGD